MTPTELKAFLAARGIKPRRHLGQNFIADERILAAIAKDANIQPDELVLEIGTGPGTLTRALAEKASRVLSVEIDPRVQRLAIELLADLKNIKFVLGDALASKTALSDEVIAKSREELEASGLAGLRVVANLPYAVSTPLVNGFLDAPFPLRGLCLLVQLEVAQRFAAAPGTKDYGPIAVLIGLGWRARVARRVGPQVFFPRPKVQSAVCLIERDEASAISRDELRRVRRLVRRLFTKRRKTLRAAARLSAKEDPELAGLDAVVEDCELDGKRRPDQLSPEEYRALAAALAARQGIV